MMFEQTGLYHRAPVGFGPAPGPRQGPDSKPFPTWKVAETHITGVVVNVGREELQALLPEGYDIDPAVENPTVLFEAMNLRNLPWLAGRGYNTLGIFANDIICRRSTELIKASYLMVLFENFCDPIVTGREELGFPKVWAELPDPIKEDGAQIHTAAWMGTDFLRMVIPDIQDQPVSSSPQHNKRPYTMPSAEGILHHRYIPAVGQPGKHDASYATFVPGGGDKIPNIKSYSTTTSPLSHTTITLTPQPFDKLPTLYNIIDGLATLKVGEGGVREVYSQVIQGASDCSGVRRVGD